MNKSEFIDMVAERAEMSKSAASRVIDAIFDATSGAIAEAVNTAGRLSIPGFGKFTTKKRAARTGRNPRTGTEIKIPERTSVSFSAGKGFRESVAGGAGGGGARKTATKKGGAAKKAGGTAGGGTTKTAAKKTGGAATKKTASKTASAARKTGGTGGGGTATKTAAKKTGGAAAKKTGGTGTAAKKTR